MVDFFPAVYSFCSFLIFITSASLEGKNYFKRILHIGNDAQNQDTDHWSLQATELEQEFINPMSCPLNYILPL